jgi:pimeloyl-ACP methyl ester carboxylesterase/DNA-binding SARP family transcriptional activator
MTHSLKIIVLGELQILRDDKPVPLPRSRKSRALLAYLMLNDRPQRRERLCEMFWDLPDDPRASLRWALSKLRPLVDEDGTTRIVADRERVTFAHDAVRIDLLDIRQKWADGAALTLAELQAMATDLSRPLLDGLDQPKSDLFQQWLIAARDEAWRLWMKVIFHLIQHPLITDRDVVKWARIMLAEDPHSTVTAAALVRSLRNLGRLAEAEDVLRAFDGLPASGESAPPPTPDAAPAPLRQTIGFCTAPDGVRIAYATVGQGPPLVKAANWLNHLDLDWQSPIWGKTFETLATANTLIRYDERGNGLSDWQVADISQQAFVNDLATVVDALELIRFPLLGMSQGCAVSIDYAVRNPGRVSALILIGGYAAGWRIGASPADREQREAVMTLTRHGWGANNPVYRHIFSRTFMPDARPEDLDWFDEFQRKTTSPENAVRFQDAFGDIDVRHLLDQVQVPTLVLHARQDQRIPIEHGLALAASIPQARFVSLESQSHIILDNEPAWQVMMYEIARFLTEIGANGTAIQP